MIIINDNDYSNPYDESNDKTKIKEWITKIIKVLLACVVIKNINNKNYKIIDNNYNNNDNNH